MLHKEELEESYGSASTSSDDEVLETSMAELESDEETLKSCSAVLSPNLNRNLERPPLDLFRINPSPSWEAKRHSRGDVDVSAETHKIERDRSKKENVLSSSINCIDSFADNLLYLSDKATSSDPISMKSCSNILECAESTPLKKNENEGVAKVGPAALIIFNSLNEYNKEIKREGISEGGRMVNIGDKYNSYVKKK